MSRRRPVRRGLLVLAVVAVLLGSGSFLLRNAPKWLDVGRLDRPARWALVLGGDPWDRTTAAATLWRDGWVEGVLLTRVRPTPDVAGGLVAPEEEISRRILLGMGVPSGAIRILADEVDSTFDEARALGRFMESRPEEVILVSEDFHTRRVRFVFRRVLGPDVPLQVVGCPSDEHLADVAWWEDPFATHQVLSELIKNVVYRLRY